MSENNDAVTKTFRQTRYANESTHLRLTIDGKAAGLKSWSRTGVAFEIDKDNFFAHSKEKIQNVKIFSSDICIFDGEISPKSINETKEGRLIIGAAFSDNFLLVEGVQSATVVNKCAADVGKITAEVLSASPEFCRILLAMSAAVKCFDKACQLEEERWRNLPFDQKLEAERIFLPSMSQKMRNVFVEFDMQISRLIDVEALPENSVYHSLVHEYIYPFFAKADLTRRAYEKPRGYAGDYEMMNQIYRSSYEGADLFGKILHNYITNEYSGESVKFRKPYLLQHLKNQLSKSEHRNVLSVASGPAVEFQEALSTWPAEDVSRIHMTLFDLDREALEHAQIKIMEMSSKRNLNPHVNYVNASVKSFLVSKANSSDSFDLIYSAGLFDYLDNATSMALTRKFYGMLNPGGTLVIGNFTKDNRSKAFLHLITKWTLIHKTKDEMLAWADSIHDCTKRIEVDNNDMLAFLVLEKNGTH